MFLLIIMKLQKAGGQFSITVPKKLVEALKWDKGVTLRFEIGGKDTLKLVKS